MWEEVVTAGKEGRRELVLTGKGVEERLQKGGLDTNIFKLTQLNFLEVSLAGLPSLPEQIQQLTNLTSLVLKGNQLTCLPPLSQLKNLKLLDVSLNKLTSLPDLSSQTSLETLNLSLNQLSGDLDKNSNLGLCSKLTVLEVTGNKLTSLGDLQLAKMDHLTVLLANQNEISSISAALSVNWPGLKKMDLSNNKLSSVPGELGDCARLKELSLLENPLSDNRLKKMASQKGTKSVLDYIRTNCPKAGGGDQGGKSGGKGKKGKGKKGKGTEEVGGDAGLEEITEKISVLGVKDDFPTIVATKEVKEVRPFIVFCFVTDLDLSGENLKKFISLQTKLHKTVCDNRNIATIATHDLTKVVGDTLTYRAVTPSSLTIVPLSTPHPTQADKLVENLKTEAEALRKEKKRSQVSGLHHYLHLLDSWSVYPCLMDSGGQRAISFPPVTNSGDTKIDEETRSVLIEVTSSSKLGDCKLVLDTLLGEMVALQGGKLNVVQGRVTGEEGDLRVTYPAKTDLASNSNITVIRE